MNEAKRNMVSRFLHHTMAVVGGFLGGYAILLRADFLGNAQTANWIYMVMAILGRNPKEVCLRVIGILIYMSGAILYVLITKKTSWNVKFISILVDCAAIIGLAFIPLDIEPVIGLYPIFFAMSLQWNAFSGVYGYASATIFSTNNTRQVALSLAEYWCDHDKKHLHKMIFFIGSLLGFHIGVVVAYFCVKYFGVKACWFDLIFAILAFLLLWIEVQWNQCAAQKE